MTLSTMIHMVVPAAAGILAGVALLLLLAESGASFSLPGGQKRTRPAPILPRSLPSAAGAVLIPMALLLQRGVLSAFSHQAAVIGGGLPFAATAVILALSSFLFCSGAFWEDKASEDKRVALGGSSAAEARVEAVLVVAAGAVILALSLAWGGKTNMEGMSRMMQCSFWLAAAGLAGAVLPTRCGRGRERRGCCRPPGG